MRLKIIILLICLISSVAYSKRCDIIDKEIKEVIQKNINDDMTYISKVKKSQDCDGATTGYMKDFCDNILKLYLDRYYTNFNSIEGFIKMRVDAAIDNPDKGIRNPPNIDMPEAVRKERIGSIYREIPSFFSSRPNRP